MIVAYLNVDILIAKNLVGEKGYKLSFYLLDDIREIYIDTNVWVLLDVWRQVWILWQSCWHCSIASPKLPSTATLFLFACLSLTAIAWEFVLQPLQKQ